LDRPRVLLADDHPNVLEIVRVLLESSYDVVGTAADGQAVLDAVELLQPDVVVLDISMPVMSGIEAARRLAKNGPRVVFLSVHLDETLVDVALAAGGRACVHKAHAAEDLLPAIREVLEGRVFISEVGLGSNLGP
jgi:DNA-binding NarL/FixJ family response regulator